MKKYVKFIVVAVAALVIASFVTVFASAETFDLAPGSDRVIFIKDLPEDYSGRGLGGSADDPFFPNPAPEGFDAEATYPKYHLTTAFYQAIDMMAQDGGTIVICGPVSLGDLQSYGSGANTKDVFTPVFSKPIKFTSVYDGVDYRATADAHLLITDGAEIGVRGESIWENLTIVTGEKSDRCISFNNNRTIVGEGIECKPFSEDFEGVANYYVSLSAGHRYDKLEGPAETHLIVRSGTYNKIVGGAWGTITANWGDRDADPDKFYHYAYQDVTAYLTIEGTTTVYGEICGSIPKAQPFGGHTVIEINGGTYACDINGAGPTSFLNDDATISVKITGGDFTDCFSLNTMAINPKGALPARATLDLSEFPQSEVKSLSALYNVITDFDVDDVKFPEWWTGPVEDETQPPETDPETDPADSAEVTEPADAVTEPEEQDTEANEEPKETKAGSKTQKPAEEEGGFPWLIVGIIAGVVVIGGAVAGVLISKKKKGGSDAE